tara:strand:+ start:753 stop:1226 length:474 start_codon:yes stop_codon:yes gene_type:complete
MAIIKNSTKFGGAMHETSITAGGYLILRSVLRQQERAVMTATAAEDEPGAKPIYPDQEALFNAANRVFHEIGGHVTLKTDIKGRRYIETHFMDSWNTVSQVAHQVAELLGLDDVVIGDSVMADYWHEHVQNEHDDDELIYLSDGMSVNKEGRLIQTG